MSQIPGKIKIDGSNENKATRKSSPKRDVESGKEGAAWAPYVPNPVPKILLRIRMAQMYPDHGHSGLSGLHWAAAL